MPVPSQPVSVIAPSTFRLANILIPTDFSSESLKALRYGIVFARQFHAALWILHVLEPPPIAGGFEIVPIALDDSEVSKNLERSLAEWTVKNVPSEIKATTLLRHGAAFEQVVATAKARDIDLIIASTHGHTGFQRVLFGSTAERIVQRAPCPMLIVREREHEFVDAAKPGEEAITRLRRILVPIDFSDSSRKALRYAMAFTTQFKAEIHCLHSLEIPYGTGEAAIVLETEAFRKEMHEQAQKQMALFLQEEGASMPEQCTVKPGAPYREILQTIDDREIDLVIMGTHGRSGVRHFFLGSTTERVVRHAHCPVLVVREREHDFIG
jgi:nucleotide-binding universal stress UspA family protein